MEGLSVLAIPVLDLAAWAPELVLAATVPLALVLGHGPRPLARLALVAALALAAGLALSAGGGAVSRPWGEHFEVGPPARLVRQALLPAALAVWLAWRPPDVRAGAGLALSALSACWLAGAATVAALLLAVAGLITGGSLLAWLGAETGPARAAVGRWHRLAGLGFATLAVSLALLSGLSGSLSLADLLGGLAHRPGLPPLALPLLLGLAGVGLALAILGDPGRHGGAGGEPLPAVVTGWLTAAPVLALAGVLQRAVASVPAAPPLAGVPDLLTLFGGALALGGFTVALAQRPLVRRLAWAATGQVGLALLLATVSGGERPLLLAASLRAFAAAQLAALLLADLRGPGRGPVAWRGAQALLLAAALLSLAAVPPLAGWTARLELLDGLLAADRRGGLAVAALATLLGYLVYLRPLVDLGRAPAEAADAVSPPPTHAAPDFAPAAATDFGALVGRALAAAGLVALLLAWGLGLMRPAVA